MKRFTECERVDLTLHMITSPVFFLYKAFGYHLDLTKV